MPAKTKGHWPRGKRRNADSGNWQRVRARLEQLLRDHWQRGVITAAACASDIGSSERSVRRWLAGEDRPSEDWQAAVAQWVRDQLIKIKGR